MSARLPIAFDPSLVSERLCPSFRPPAEASQRIQCRASGHFQVQHDSEKGKCALFCRPACSGDVLFGDRPLALMEVDKSRKRATSCDYCACFIGMLSDQLLPPLSASPARGEEGARLLPFIDEVDQCLAKPVPCRHRCGQAYCSPHHEARAWQEGHSLLCARDSEKTAGQRRNIAEYWRHVRKTYQLFGFAAQLLASMASDSQVEEAVDDLCYKAWWEVVADRKRWTKKARSAYVIAMQIELTNSFNLFRRAFAPFFPSHLISFEVYARVMGVAELNNVAITLPNPANDYLHVLSSLPLQMWKKEEGKMREVSSRLAALSHRGKVFDANMTICLRGSTQQAEVKAEKQARRFLSSCPLPPNEYTGLYYLVSTLNHSCRPSASLEFSTSSTVQVEADGRAEAGQEITISYIDNALSRKKRRRELAHHAFLCKCQLCADAGRPRKRSRPSPS